MMPHTLAASVFERITKPLLPHTSVEKNGGYSWDKWLQVWPHRTDLLHGHSASQGMSSLLDTGTQSPTTMALKNHLKFLLCKSLPEQV